MIWILVGLLFKSSGLYLGFDYPLSFLYMIIGAFCFAFGVALMVLKHRERPKSGVDTRLSPNFVSMGNQTKPSVPQEPEQASEPEPASNDSSPEQAAS